MKVLFMTSWYPTDESPFWGAFVREHAKAAARHHDVAVVHLMGHDPHLRKWWSFDQDTDSRLVGGLPTYRVCHRMVPVPCGSFSLFIWSAMQSFQKLLAKGFCPDVIHAHVYEAAVPAVLLGKRYGIPVVVTEHSSKFPGGGLSRFDWWKARYAFSQAQVVMPVSNFLLQAIESYGIHGHYMVIPNSVDRTVFFSPQKKAEKQRPCFRLLVVGLLDSGHKKGIPTLFRALVLLGKSRKDWHLDIVGDGPARRDYEQLVIDKGLSEQVTFHGAKGGREVADHMHQADAFVLPSPIETFSVTTVEALMTGTPVLVTACGGPEEYVSDEIGMVIPAGNEAALCDGLDAMLDSLERFSPEHIAQYAASRFSTEAVGNRLDQVYDTVAKKSRRAAMKNTGSSGKPRVSEAGKR